MNKVIIVDFDGVLCRHDDFPNVGPIENYVVEALFSLKQLGYTIKIWTCRTASYWGRDREKHIKLVKDFLDEENIPYDELILDLDKPLASVYIDDRAIRYKGNWWKVVNEIVNLDN